MSDKCPFCNKFIFKIKRLLINSQGTHTYECKNSSCRAWLLETGNKTQIWYVIIVAGKYVARQYNNKTEIFMFGNTDNVLISINKLLNLEDCKRAIKLLGFS